MRKISVFLIAALMLTVAAVAYAQERNNTYTVSGAVSPSNAGSTKKPVPVQIKFAYTVAEAANLRPSPVQKYSIRFTGLRQNSNSFPGCTAAQINANEGVGDCPKGSRIGTGSITAVAGGENDRANKSINCPLNLEVYNSRRNKAAIYVVGGPQAPSGKTTACPTTTNAALDANFVKRGNATALEFNVPLVPFRQQLGTVEVAVVRVQSTIPRKTVRRNGKTTGFFEAIGGCTGNRRVISVTFLNEDNKTSSAQGNTRCRK